MSKVVEINLKGNVVKVFANNNTVLHEKCRILGKTLHCVNLGSTFSANWVSREVLIKAIEIGINLESSDIWSQLQSRKNEFVVLLDEMNSSSANTEKNDTNSTDIPVIKQIIVTTGDLKEDYVVIGPVYFQVSNKGIFSSELSRLIKKHSDILQGLKKQGNMTKDRMDWGFLYGEYSVGQNDFDKAFFVAVEELKIRAKIVGGDAIICMRQDIDLDTTSIQKFYLQIYGTAVKLKNNDAD